ncbi:TPA: hypothetical protein I8Z35_000183 [Legionella pneumophila]|uniref:hypothetical protein n=1 Tax=Legionella pneumophila TaxID=446 RepID=UPI0012B5F98C|nr:hypothetical protein [Legionella pneumophila]MCZ4679721.1 hypothetical protein [Legionella pneumophila]MDW8886664.1 hypothetical protein [Legionella pneumophila]HAT1676570.1 hypothetical protein [Legionella pneumophila]HAT1724756.1 hypothetical protein [Legionella pneumophila]HAT1728755.1 hypothetical protein [Legionella pneumophila]
MRFPCSATSSNVGLGAYYSAGRCVGHGAAIQTLLSLLRYLLVQVLQPVSLVAHDDL